MSESRAELLQGTLEMLVLKVLSLEPMHGWGVSYRLRQISGEVFDVNQGSLYPALQRMLVKGWVSAEWKISANNRRARVYTLTAAGRKQLAAERAEFERVVTAMRLVLDLA